MARDITPQPRSYGCPSVCRIVCASECPKYCCPAEKKTEQLPKIPVKSVSEDDMRDDDNDDEDQDDEEEEKHNQLVLDKMKELKLKEKERQAQDLVAKIAIAKAKHEENENKNCPSSCNSQCTPSCCRLCTIPGHKPHFCCKVFYRQAFPDCPAICEKSCDISCPRHCCGPRQSGQRRNIVVAYA